MRQIIVRKNLFPQTLLLESLWLAFASLREPAQMFLNPCLPHYIPILSQVRHLSTLFPATSFFRLFPSLTRVNMAAGKKLSEGMFELWKNIWKAWTAQSSFVSSGLRRLWGSRQNCLQNFQLFFRCNFRREIMDRICAPWNNDGGKNYFFVHAALGCLSFEPVLTLWDWLLRET